MDVGSRRKSAGPRIGGVMAGSVWESRMKLDEFKGGIKVFNGEQDCCSSNNNNNNNNDNDDDNSVGNDEESAPTTTSSTTASNDLSGAIFPVVPMDKKANLRTKQSPPAPTGGKRKTWKSENLEGSPFQIARQRSEMSKNLDEQCKEELSVSSDGTTKRSPLLKKTRSESIKDLSVSVDGIEKKTLPTRAMKSKSSSSQKVSGEITNTGSDAIDKSSVQFLRKVKSESVNKVPDDSCNGNAKNNSLQLVKAKSESSKAFEESSNGIQHNSVVKPQKLGDDESENNIKESNEGIEKNCKVFDISEEEKVITSNAVLLEVKKSPTKTEAIEYHHDEHDLDDEFEEASDEKIEVEIEKKSLVVKEICIAEQKPNQIVVEDKKLLHSNETPSIGLKKKQSSPPQPSLIRVHPSPTKTKSIPLSNGYQRIPRTHGKLQSFVDLVMWKDVSKSAFVFGIGTFFIISSSYTKDLNISLISVFSYLGLAYLAAIFLFRSFISRGSIDSDESSMGYVVGEEEAIWLIKLFLPYVNEFLLKLKALFSGDPATTMKMAVLLFVLARCGNSITIWKMAKLSFFGVFTVPKICSSYSPHLTAYGTFWIRRFGDAWESCSHKKAVAFAIFTLVWNLSSIIARIWAVFMLFVAFRYYKNSLIREGWVEEDKEEEEVVDTSRQAQNRGPVQRPRRRPITLDTGKQKKSF